MQGVLWARAMLSFLRPKCVWPWAPSAGLSYIASNSIVIGTNIPAPMGRAKVVVDLRSELESLQIVYRRSSISTYRDLLKLVSGEYQKLCCGTHSLDG